MAAAYIQGNTVVKCFISRLEQKMQKKISKKVYLREAFIRGRRLLNNTEKLQFYISTSIISSSFSIRKTALSASSMSESVIRSNVLGRSDSSYTSSCDINCSLPF